MRQEQEPVPNGSDALTAEAIKQTTRFELQFVYPGFDEDDGFISPQVHEDRDSFVERYGEDSVVTSFYSEDGKVRLGLFLRKSQG